MTRPSLRWLLAPASMARRPLSAARALRGVLASRCSPVCSLGLAGALRAQVRVAGSSRRWLSLRQVPRAEARRDPGETALVPRCRQRPGLSEWMQPALVPRWHRVRTTLRTRAARPPAKAAPTARPTKCQCAQVLWRLAPPRRLERSYCRLLIARTRPLQKKELGPRAPVEIRVRRRRLVRVRISPSVRRSTRLRRLQWAPAQAQRRRG